MTRLSPLDEQRLLVKVSKMYYEEGLDQDDIILRLSLSRSKVSRLLQQARDEGIVQITVHTPRHLFADLENKLEKTFGLDEAILVEAVAADPYKKVIHDIGIAAAAYIERAVGVNTVLGISWGATLNSMVENLHNRRLPKAKVVQIIGGLGQPEAEVHATDLCHRLARSLGTQLTLLPVPGIVATQQARNVLMSDQYVKQAIDMFGDLDMAFVGIGAPVTDSVLIRDGSILTREELDTLVENGAAGDIALRFFDAQGQLVQSDIDQRVIGISYEQLKCIPKVVGVAGGREKIRAVLGALRGKLVNVLITDSETARQLLQLSFNEV